MKRIPFIIFLVCCVLAGSSLSCASKPPEPGWRLQVTDPRDHVIYYSIPIDTAATITFSYRHSVSGSRVIGTFELTTDGELKPYSTSFSSYGPGLPLDLYEDYKIESGVVTVFHKEEPRSEIRLWVTPLTEETIIIADRDYPLYIFSDQEKLLVIAAVRIDNF